MVLFCRAGMTITPSHQQILQRSNRVFFISGAEMGSYLDYTFERLERIVHTRDLRTSDKAFVLRDVGNKVINHLMDDPRSGEAIRHSEHYVRATVDFLLQNPTASALITGTVAEDPSLMSHAISTSVFAILIGARLLGEDRAALNRIGMGALLLDIGMTRLETIDHLRPEVLTAETREQVFKHAELGAELAVEHALERDIVDIIRHHHERLDGSGYPDHLRDDQLSLPVRIAAVADVYDALTSPRLHRAAFSHVRALRVMAGEKGRFDPSAFDALLHLVLSNETLVSAFYNDGLEHPAARGLIGRQQ
jgi:putative nucleotidyltransferase with HDIG domain